MDQKWIHILVMLVLFYQNVAGEDRIVKERERVDITCNLIEKGTMVVWFRVLDNSGMEFIASFSPTGLPKTPPNPSIFSSAKISQNILTLQSFRKATDSGAYSCASLYKGSELKFGAVTRLVGENKIKPQVATTTATTTKQNLCTTATPCVCNGHNKEVEDKPDMFCTPLILGPLAGGCGLLLLLLIITTAYCNKIRTRRCPHHYKRKPRAMAAGKQMMTNRDI